MSITDRERFRALQNIAEVLGYHRDNDFQPIEHSLDRLATAAERIAAALERAYPDIGTCRATVNGQRCPLPAFHKGEHQL